MILAQGRGVDKDEKKGFEWLLRAADENDAANGQLAVGNAYMTGRGVPRDLDKAELYLRRASEKGLTVADMLLATLQRLRTGVAPTNVDLDKRRADEGDATAQFRLGMSYRKGRDVPRDLTIALKYLEQSADQGFPMAQWALAEMYERGEGVTQDYAVALALYAAAAEEGIRNAQYRLGIMHEQGLGVDIDRVAAYTWISIAARRGDKQAQSKKAELEPQLKPTEKAAAEKATREFFAAHRDQDADMGEGQTIKWKLEAKEPEPKTPK